jgi:Ca2+-binding EF-hand superfamily protein
MAKTAIVLVAGFLIATGLFQATAVAGDKDQTVAEKAGERFAKLDTNRDGKLNKEEFKKFEPQKHKVGTSRKVTNHDKFHQYDRDNDGFISPAEFRRIFELRMKK